MADAKSTRLERVWKKQFVDIMADSFGRYAKYIIQDRALPDVRDGLKPVQRRILYAMYRLGLYPDRAPRKAATAVGEVIGKYHPHGDSSIYEALVRMSQWWKNNLPLIEMQGNNGSIDGDSPAAMRYTEARLSAFGMGLVGQIDKQTVKFVLNFDDTEKEPTVLPALLPNLLVNGATGIAAGYATNIPPFNLAELLSALIYRADHPDCPLAAIAKLMPGPDFPTGGTIHGSSGIHEAYATGRGKIVLRAQIVHETDKQKRRLVITQIPFETNKSAIVRTIEEICDANAVACLKEVRDESDKRGIRVVLEYDGDEAAAETLKKYLFKHTPLQINYYINSVVISQRKPIQLTLLTFLDTFLNHAHETLKAAATFDLQKAQQRLEIVQGLIKAASVINEVITLIRQAQDKPDAINKLMARFAFSLTQAEAIVMLRLYRLSNTDIVALQTEAKELDTRIQLLAAIATDAAKRLSHLKKIWQGYINTFGHARRTKIVAQELGKIVIDAAEVVVERDYYVFISRDGYLKACPLKSVDEAQLSTYKLKEADALVSAARGRSLDRLLVITNFGNFALVPLHKLKPVRLRDLGVHINTLVTLRDSEKILFALPESTIPEGASIFLASRDGMAKRFVVADALAFKSSRPSMVMNLKDGDEVVSARLLLNPLDECVLTSKMGVALRFNVDDVPLSGLRSMGVRGIKLREHDAVVDALIIPPNESGSLLFFAQTGVKRIKVGELIKLSRATMGKPVFNQIKSAPYRLHSMLYAIDHHVRFGLHTPEGTIQTFVVNQIPVLPIDARMSAPLGSDLTHPFVIDQTLFSQNPDLFSVEQTQP